MLVMHNRHISPHTYGENYDDWLLAFEVVRTSRVEPKKFYGLSRRIWFELEFA